MTDDSVVRNERTPPRNVYIDRNGQYRLPGLETVPFFSGGRRVRPRLRLVPRAAEQAVSGGESDSK